MLQNSTFLLVPPVEEKQKIVSACSIEGLKPEMVVFEIVWNALERKLSQFKTTEIYLTFEIYIHTRMFSIQS